MSLLIFTSQIFFLQSLEDMDLSTFKESLTKKKNHLKSDRRGSSGNSPKTQEHSRLNFGNGAYHFDQSSFSANSDHFDYDNNGGIFSNFFKQSNRQSIQNQMKVQRSGISLPKLSSFLSLHDHDIVMSKHHLRQKAIGGVCLPDCDVSDVVCNCGKLFECVKQMDNYDMAV